ncbi:MAG TPA: nodulation protein NfeD [Candidatus Sulfotelmatobacter sp.]|nr:nodulation protein NfeD [Candidatus Sulfotelmatobacter sp.]
MKRGLAILFAVLTCGFLTKLQAADVGLIKINGAIGPATASYIARAIMVAGSRHDACLVIQLDTPGGLLDSTKEIVQTFYASKVPIVVYVAPSGGSATSAGCFITLAADIAAMAPNTSIGAAHPVSAGGPGGAEKPDDIMKQKLENYAASTIEAIAQKRGRNVEWAKASVIKSESITAEKALELKVIDLIAPDLPDLLKQVDGRQVNGHVLKTASASVVAIPMAARERLFQLLWRPEVMLVLMLMAIYGIIGELSNPGAILPGVVGAIALVLALYMAAILPINAAGLALIGLAIVLFVIDVFAPTHGVLTFGGIVAFFLGALMLFNRGDPAFRLSLVYIIPATLLTAAFFLFIVGAGLRAQLLPVRAGAETMLGKTTPALERIDARGGKIFIEGEYWNAVSEVPIEPGQPVEVVGLSGLTLRVKPKQVQFNT